MKKIIFLLLVGVFGVGGRAIAQQALQPTEWDAALQNYQDKMKEYFLNEAKKANKILEIKKLDLEINDANDNLKKLNKLSATPKLNGENLMNINIQIDAERRKLGDLNKKKTSLSTEIPNLVTTIEPDTLKKLLKEAAKAADTNKEVNKKFLAIKYPNVKDSTNDSKAPYSNKNFEIFVKNLDQKIKITASNALKPAVKFKPPVKEDPKLPDTAPMPPPEVVFTPPTNKNPKFPNTPPTPPADLLISNGAVPIDNNSTAKTVGNFSDQITCTDALKLVIRKATHDPKIISILYNLAAMKAAHALKNSVNDNTSKNLSLEKLFGDEAEKNKVGLEKFYKEFGGNITQDDVFNNLTSDTAKKDLGSTVTHKNFESRKKRITNEDAAQFMFSIAKSTVPDNVSSIDSPSIADAYVVQYFNSKDVRKNSNVKAGSAEANYLGFTNLVNIYSNLTQGSDLKTRFEALNKSAMDHIKDSIGPQSLNGALNVCAPKENGCGKTFALKFEEIKSLIIKQEFSAHLNSHPCATFPVDNENQKGETAFFDVSECYRNGEPAMDYTGNSLIKNQ